MPTPAKGKTPAPQPLRAKAPKISAPKDSRPTRFTYALTAWSVVRSGDGWYVAPTSPGLHGKPQSHRRPFESVETACQSIARSLAVELADRHTRSIKFHKLETAHPLYGLKPQTRLKKSGKASVT